MASLLSRFNVAAARFISSTTQPFPYIKVRPASIFNPCVVLIQLCSSTSHLIQVHSRLIALGLFPFWAPKLLKQASDLGNLSYTVLLFKCVDSPGTFCVNNVLKAYSVVSSANETIAMYFKFLRDRSFLPNSYTFLYIVSSCANVACLSSGMKCHGQMLKHGLACLPVQNSLIYFYGICGYIELAKKVLEEMSVTDVISWNSILSGYTAVGELHLAHELFDIMPEKSVISWNIMLTGYLMGNNPGCAMMLFRKMIFTGNRGNERTLAMVISACGRSKRIREGRSVHAFGLRLWNALNLIVCTSLIDMYSKCHKLEMAQRIFQMMIGKNLISWNAMLLGHCIHGNPVEGLNLFVQMTDLRTSRQKNAVVPDDITFIGVLCACARLRMLSQGEWYFSEMTKMYGIKPNFAHYWCLANMYIGAGLPHAAKNLLQGYADASVSSNSSRLVDLLVKCRFHGSSTTAERIAKYFLEIDPSNFSHYHFLANIYAAAGKWDEVIKVQVMVKKTLATRRVPTVGLQDLNYVVQSYPLGMPWQEDIHIGSVHEQAE